MIRLGSDRIFDGSGSEPASGYVEIAGARLSSVRPVTPGSPPLGAVVLDGMSILPGLIDAHTHLGSVIQPHGTAVPLAVVASQIFANARIALDEGFTTVRDVAGLDGGIASAIKQGLIDRASDLAFRAHAQPARRACRLAAAVRSWAVARESARPAATIGACGRGRADARRRTNGTPRWRDSNKGRYQWRLLIERRGSRRRSVGIDELRAAVEVARNRHTYVTAHAHYPEAIQLGLEAGIRCFEHATFADAETIQSIREYEAAIVATLSVVERYQDPTIRESLRPEVARAAADAFPAMSEMVATAVRTGVTVGLGTDQVGVEQRRRGRELAVRARVTSPLEAISAATGVNARILRLSEMVGRLAQGLIADLIAVEGDPRSDPELFADPERVRLVVRSGVIWKNTLPEPLAGDVARSFSANSSR